MYIDAIHDSANDVIKVVERVNGKRVHREYPAKYVFYHRDPGGRHESIFGDRLSKFTAKKHSAFRSEIKRRENRGETLFESDCSIVFRCLADHYMDAEPPQPNVAFFDIEADFDDERGFADPGDPFNRITAIGVHLQWMKETACLVLKPEGMDAETAQGIVDGIPEAILMESEEELLDTFLDLVDDADVLSGWNSKAYDIPYLVNRIGKVLGRRAKRRLCLWDRYPVERKSRDKYDNEFKSYSLVGRVHLDYMALYSKYTYEEKHSMALDFIAGVEVGESKVEYKGTLDQLYNDDFGTFVRYNVQDVELLAKLDAKLQFISLANSIAHSNTVLLDTVLGTVAQIDQAVINEAHARGLVVNDKVSHGKDAIRAAGAFVFPPKKGLHKWIGSMDLASLYPSILRSSNMSPDTIVGQVRHTVTGAEFEAWIRKIEADDFKRTRGGRRRAAPAPAMDGVFGGGDGDDGGWEDEEREAGAAARKRAEESFWDGKFATREYDLVMERDTETELVLDYEDGRSETMTGADIHDLVFGREWCITRNGTILTLSRSGVIPALLSRWYSERRETQAKAREARAADDDDLFKYHDRRQLVRKILLNSAYGALLNRHSRFYDPRLGQSITLNGRGISKHMAAKVNEIITGEYDNLGEAILYGDTDSTYFSASALVGERMESGEMDRETLIEFYDAVCDEANATFPDYMRESHNCPEKFGSIISAAREAVCESGLFIKKKRYGLLVFDDDGKRLDGGNSPGKVKVKGLESQRSDTPKYMQEFLDALLENVLYGTEREEIMDMIRRFRKRFRAMEPWEKGTPKRVNKLADKTEKWRRTGKCGTGHALASINWNSMLDALDDRHSMRITDGMKIIVSKLKPIKKNLLSIDAGAIPREPNGAGGEAICPWFLRMTSIAIPIDEGNIPDWFRALPFDERLMEETIVDRKIANLLEVLEWEIPTGREGASIGGLFG